MIINNFNLSLLKRLLKQSLIVNEQIMIEISDSMMKSVSFSGTKSLIKIWQLPIESFVDIEAESEVDKSTYIQNYDGKFNLYILKGSLFLKYLDVFSMKNPCKLTINIDKNTNQATQLTIDGSSENGSKIKTNFVLTTEEMIVDKVEDYNFILKQCTPEKSYKQFSITEKQLTELKSLIKKLHKSIVNNSNYITFSFDDNGNLNVFDKAFNIELEYDSKDVKNLEFKILKTDLLMFGEHSFVFYTDNNTPKVILGTNYGPAVVWCTSVKVLEDVTTDEIDDINDIADSLDLEEYGLTF
nr:MAG TPA: hypothetical protein [Caudoviricetes sp.]